MKSPLLKKIVTLLVLSPVVMFFGVFVTFSFAPSFVEASEIAVPKKIKLKNGLSVYFLQRDLPLFSAELLLPVGSAHDAPRLSGIASLTSSLLDKGTKKRSRGEIQNQLDQWGASFSADSGKETTTISVSGLKKHQEKLLELLSETIRSPRFDTKDIQFEKAYRISSLKQSVDSSRQLLRRAATRVAFRKTPLSKFNSGNLRSIERIQRDHIRAYHNQFYTPKGAHLILVSQTPFSEMRDAVEGYFEDWAPSKKAVKVDGKELRFPDYYESYQWKDHRARFASSPRRQITLVDAPGKSQAHLAWVRPSVPREDSRFYALNIANQSIGGGFGSRLMQRIRNELGLTYTIRSSIGFGKNYGFFQVSSHTKNSQVKKLILEVDNLMSSLASKSVLKEEEIQKSKGYLVGSFPLRLESPESLASVYLYGSFLGNPLSHVNAYSERIEKTDKKLVREVAREFFNPDRTKLVVVGDQDKVLRSLKQLGDVTILQAKDLL
jgi:zinc protease